MKILHCSDFHADWLTSGVSRYDDVAAAVEQTVAAAFNREVDLYLFTGDLADPDDCPRTLRAVSLAIEVAMRLARAGIPSWWVGGNHDVVNDGSGRTTLSPLAALGEPRVQVFEHPSHVLLPCPAGSVPASAIILPYPAVSSSYDPAAYVRERVALDTKRLHNVALVAGHLMVEGAQPGDETTEMARGRDVFFPFEECDPRWLLLGGHYHQGQTFERHGRQLHVPGSLVRLNHGEEKIQPRFLLWEI